MSQLDGTGCIVVVDASDKGPAFGRLVALRVAADITSDLGAWWHRWVLSGRGKRPGPGG